MHHDNNLGAISPQCLAVCCIADKKARKHLAHVSLLMPWYLSTKILTGMSTMMFFQHKNKWKLVPDHWETGICSTEWRCRSHTESRSSDQSESHERDTARVIKHLTEAALLHDVTTRPMIIKSPFRPHLQVHYLSISWARTLAVSLKRHFWMVWQ